MQKEAELRINYINNKAEAMIGTEDDFYIPARSLFVSTHKNQ